LTGVSGLDKLLGGGLPEQSFILVAGGPGTGKTTLATQFLVNGIRTCKDNAVFVSLTENRADYFREMKRFGWDLAKLEAEKKFTFVDASPMRHIPGQVNIGKMSLGKQDFTLLSLIENINAAVKTAEVKASGQIRLVVDPLTPLVHLHQDLANRRNLMLDFVDAVLQTGATCIATLELPNMGATRRYQLEEYVAQGVILMQTIKAENEKELTRMLQVEKMRGSEINDQLHPYAITENGIQMLKEMPAQISQK